MNENENYFSEIREILPTNFIFILFMTKIDRSLSSLCRDVKASRPDWPRGQKSGLGLGLELLASASTSRDSGLGLKVLASASNNNLTSCFTSLPTY